MRHSSFSWWWLIVALLVLLLLRLWGPTLLLDARLATAWALVNGEALLAQGLHRPGTFVGWAAWWHGTSWTWVERQPGLVQTTNLTDGLLLVVLALLVVSGGWQRWPGRPSTAFGSARDPTRRELLPLWDPPQLPHPTRLALAAIVLLAPGRIRGRRHQRPVWVARLERRLRQRARQTHPLHVGLPLGTFRHMRVGIPVKWLYEGTLIIGVMGTGKTLRLIMRAVLACMGHLSLVLADPKRELRDVLAAPVGRRMPVWIVDPRDPQARHFNPLQHVTTLEDAYRLASMLVELGPAQPPGASRRAATSAWETYAVETLVILIWHLHVTEPQAPFQRLLDLGAFLSFSQMKRLVARSADPEVQARGKQWVETLGASAEALGAALGTLGTALKPYRTPLVTEWTARDELPLAGLAQHPIALFLSIADHDLHALRPLVAFLYDRLFGVLVAEAVAQPGRRLRHGCLCLLDEFGNLGRIPEFARFLTLARARRIALVLAIQNLAQLLSTYGPDIDATIASNCRNKILLKNAGPDELRMFNRLLGTTTVHTPSVSQTMQGRSIQYREVARDRVTEDELFNMAEDEAVIVTGHVRAFRVRLPLVSEDPRTRHRVQLPPPP